MANEEHVARLKQSVEAWNLWRRENPGIAPDLCFEDLRGMDLKMANLGAADLMGGGSQRREDEPQRGELPRRVHALGELQWGEPQRSGSEVCRLGRGGFHRCKSNRLPHLRHIRLEPEA
jgi:hypothetical protein